MISVRRIRIDLTPEQQAILDGQSKICNWLYNQLLAHANELRVQFRATKDQEIGKTLYTKRGLRNLIPELKKEHPFLLTVFSSPLKNAGLRLSSAIQDYQDSRHGRRKGPLNGWPKFRSWKKKWFSLEYDEPKKGFKVEPGQIRLSLGKSDGHHNLSIVLKLAEPLPKRDLGRVRALRITRDGARRYFVVLTLDQLERGKENNKEQAEPRIIAFDPNHKNLVYGAGTDQQAIEVHNLASLKKLDRRIDLLKARRDKCKRKSVFVTRKNGSAFWKASRRWEFFNTLVNEAYRIRREQTKTYLYTVANQVCKRYEVVCVGDYTPRGGGITTGMRRAMNNQSLIGRFKQTMRWVCARSGRLYYEYSEKGTTRTCHSCKHVVEEGLAPEIREWTCPKCGMQHIRDENSALNGLEVSIQQNDLLPRSGHLLALEPLARWAWWVVPSGVQVAPRGRDGSFYQSTARKLKRGDASLPIQAFA